MKANLDNAKTDLNMTTNTTWQSAKAMPSGSGKCDLFKLASLGNRDSQATKASDVTVICVHSMYRSNAL
eukprot:2095145-Amphidinium_carterae.1